MKCNEKAPPQGHSKNSKNLQQNEQETSQKIKNIHDIRLPALCIEDKSVKITSKVVQLFRCKLCLLFVESLDTLVCHWTEGHGIRISGAPRVKLSKESEDGRSKRDGEGGVDSESERDSSEETGSPDELGSRLSNLNLRGHKMNLNSNSTVNTAGIFYQNSSLFTVPVYTPGLTIAHRTTIQPQDVQLQVPVENNIPIVHNPNSSDFNESLSDNNFGCPICNLQFQTRSQLMSHTRKHMKEGSKCTLCEQTFPSHKDLKTHMGDKTDQDEFSITCGICSGTFPTQECLSNHLNSHKQTGSAPVIIDNPSAERRYSCSLCNRTFKNSQHVQRHLRVHTGEKPFSCETCGQSFSLNHNLQRHMRTHTGEKQHACKVCGKEFAEGHNLKRHLISAHDGPSNYVCNICSKKFAENSILKKHQLKTHGKKAE